MKVTKSERETVINFDEESNLASVYTFNGKLKSKLAKFAKEFPQACKLVKNYAYGAVDYAVDKSMLSINFKKPLTEKQLKQKRNALKKAF